MATPPTGGGPAQSGSHRFILRILLWVVLPVLAAFAGLVIWRRIEESYPVAKLERSSEAQRLINLWMYEMRERSGGLLPQRDAQLAIRGIFLQDVLARSLPLREQFENGRYEARLERATLTLEDGLASITLSGHGRMLGPDASPLEADLVLQTHIDVIEFRPRVGTLRAGLAVTHVHVVRAGSRGDSVGAPAGGGLPFMNPVARYFGGLKVEDWNRERPSIEIPIRLDQEITLPELDGDVSLAARRLPLALHISALTVLEDRVVLSLALEDAAPFGERLLGGPAPLELTSELRSRAERSVRDLYQHHRVAAERERLLGRVRALASHDPLWQGIVESSSDVVVLAPKRVLQTLCDRVAQGYLQGAVLDFDPDLRAHLDQQVKVTVLGKKAGAGRIFGDVSVTHLRGLLRVSGAPQLTLLPPDALDFATPVRVLRGQGTVRLDMHWDPSFLVAIVCRGFAFQENLTGDVLPFSHLVHARIRFAESGSKIVGQPVVRRDRFAVPCEFTPSSIRKVRAALKEQDKFFRCGIAINQDSLLTKVRQLVRNDVHIRLPKALFKPFALPVSLQGEYEAGGFHISAIAGDPEVAVRPGYLLFGFRAALKVRSTKPIVEIIRRAARADTSRPTGDRPGAPSGPGGTKAGGGTD